MRIIGIKRIWSMVAKPRCYGNGGNLSSMDCGKCAKMRSCIENRNEHPEPKVFFFFSKEGEAYPKGRMNGDGLCGVCANRPRLIPNPKYCEGCFDEFNMRSMFKKNYDDGRYAE